MSRFPSVLSPSLAAAALIALGVAPALAQSPVLRSSEHDYRLVTVAEGLIQPWSIAFVPGGDMLVTEKPGRLRIIRNGRLLPDPVPGVPAVHAQGQGGLLEVALHPNFSSNRLIYLSFSKPVAGGGATTAVVRGRFENDRLTDVQEIFEADSRGQGHYGSRLAFDRAGFIYITVGDRQVPPTGDVAALEAHPAQDLSNHHGTVNRLHDDGRVPADNPFVGRPGARGEIFTYGHRNAQGLAIHPETGEIWITEHGPQGGDELNLLKPGANYGWPVIGYGVNYRSGARIHEGTHREGMEQPSHIWVPSIGVSGLTFYTGDAFPGWKGDLFAGGMAGEQLARITLDGTRVVNVETLVRNRGRIRDVRQGPDGFIYLAIDDRQGGASPILRMEPATRNGGN